MVHSIVAEKTYRFAIRIVKIHVHLCTTERSLYSLSKQLLRSGTSIGANVEEALGGHSEKDFSAKMSIAYKEARETRYWLRLLEDCNVLSFKMAHSFLSDIDEILRILGSIIHTIKSKKKQLQTPNS
ncbi:MAG: four helix bundle protein [Chitinophagaceae bacterium]|nr:four helix bundle protein [Chitinophagaceae bacterium]